MRVRKRQNFKRKGRLNEREKEVATSSERGRKKQWEAHILHRLDGLTGVIWAIYYSHPTRTGYPTIGSGTRTRKTDYRVLVSGYFCDVYGHPLFMKKNSKSCHILHRLDGLTGVIWVIYYTHGKTGHLPYQN